MEKRLGRVPSSRRKIETRVTAMRRLTSIRVLLPAVTGLMTLVLVTIFAIYAMHALERREQARRIPLIVNISYDLFEAI